MGVVVVLVVVVLELVEDIEDIGLEDVQVGTVGVVIYLVVAVDLEFVLVLKFVEAVVEIREGVEVLD